MKTGARRGSGGSRRSWHPPRPPALLPPCLPAPLLAAARLQHGAFAEQVLKAWPGCKRYYLVDLWGHQVGLRQGRREVG